MGPASLLPARAPHGRLPRGVPPGARFDPFGPVGPDFDGLPPPAFDDEHGLRGPPGRPAPGGGGTGPPPFGSGAMYF